MTTAHEGRRAAEAHLSEDELAAAADGLQDAPAGLEGHLRDCVGCRDLVASVAEIRGVLADLPRPVLPREVVIRVDAALAREVEARRAATAAESRSAPTGIRAHKARLVGWGLAGLLALTGAVTIGALADSGGEGAANSASASGSGPNIAAGRTDAGPRLNPDLATIAPGSAASAAALPTVLASADLAAWVGRIAPAGGFSRVHGDLATVQAQVLTCLADPRFHADAALDAQIGELAGTAAVLVVYADGDDPGAVYAVAYAVPCSTTRYDVLAEGVVPGLAG